MKDPDMRYTYSVVRFVPDPARGEFVNVAAIVGSEETGEWDLRQVENIKRARQLDDRRALPAITGFLEDVGDLLDEYLEADEAEENTQPFEPTESWLADLHERHHNVVQLSVPTPIVADSIDDAMRIVFEELIIEPEARRLPYVRRTRARQAVRAAYRKTRKLKRDENYFERVVLHAGEFQEKVDFVVANGSAVQIAHAWSFRVPHQEAVAQRVRSWGWALSHLKERGGSVELPGRGSVEIPADVDLEVVFVQPTDDLGDSAFAEGMAVFDELSAVTWPLKDAPAVAERALELLGVA